MVRPIGDYDPNRVNSTSQREPAPDWQPPEPVVDPPPNDNTDPGFDADLSDYIVSGPDMTSVDNYLPESGVIGPALGGPLLPSMYDPAEEMPPPNAIDPNRNVSEDLKDMLGFLIGSTMAQKKKESAKQSTSPFDNETVMAMFIVGAVVLFAAFM